KAREDPRRRALAPRKFGLEPKLPLPQKIRDICGAPDSESFAASCGSCPFSLDKAMEKVYNNLRNVRGALRPKTRMQNPEVRYRMEKSA
ncbi:hypothetical protein D1157_15580, partial [Anaerotruncus sp. X29]|nr:hypothetical protein [Anaerotruncus sp. X29]